jgi:hypothetical protein
MARDRAREREIRDRTKRTGEPGGVAARAIGVRDTHPEDPGVAKVRELSRVLPAEPAEADGTWIRLEGAVRSRSRRPGRCRVARGGQAGRAFSPGAAVDPGQARSVVAVSGVDEASRSGW